MIKPETRFGHQLRDALNDMRASVTKIPGSVFKAGLPDLAIEYLDYFRWCELKYTELDVHTPPARKIPVLGDLSCLQWDFLLKSARTHAGQPHHRAALVAHAVKLNRVSSALLVTLAGSPAFMAKATIGLHILNAIPDHGGWIYKQQGIAVAKYPTPGKPGQGNQTPTWPVLCPWWEGNYSANPLVQYVQDA